MTEQVTSSLNPDEVGAAVAIISTGNMIGLPKQEVNVESRNQLLTKILDDNPNRPLPKATAYPFLVDGPYGPSYMDTKYQPGGLLPVSEAVKQGKDLALMLGVDGRLAVSMQLRPEPVLPGTITVVDVRVSTSGEGAGEEWKGKGYGKTMYLELLKAIPPGVEITSSSWLRPDGQRMWDWLITKGLAEERPNYTPPPEGTIGPGRYITRLNQLQS